MKPLSKEPPTLLLHFHCKAYKFDSCFFKNGCEWWQRQQMAAVVESFFHLVVRLSPLPFIQYCLFTFLIIQFSSRC